MNYGIVKPVLIAFFVSVLLSPMMIRYLHKLKFGQFIRGEGPESHLKKSGTPTMGGLIILLGIVIASLFYVRRYPMIIPVYPTIQNNVIPCPITLPVARENPAAPTISASNAQNTVFKNRKIFSIFPPAAL